MSKTKKTVLIVISAILSVILLVFLSIMILKYIGKSKFKKDDSDVAIPSVEEVDDTIIYNNKKYRLNPDIVSILLMGIDSEISKDEIGYGQNGQADTIMVMAVDTKQKTIKIIPISRETMVDINEYTASGDYAGNRLRQICLAYAYGGNSKQSSENMKTSVKRLLYGIDIDSYITIDLKGIEKFTEVLGGVEVTALEDFSYNKEFYNKGQTVNLKGGRASAYLRNRGEDTESNNRRMERHKQFVMAALNTAGNKVLKDFSLFAKYYNAVSPYIDTDLDISRTTYLATELLKVDIGNSIEFKSISGTTVKGEKWMEFTPDEQSLTETVIDVFYTEVK